MKMLLLIGGAYLFTIVKIFSVGNDCVYTIKVEKDTGYTDTINILYPCDQVNFVEKDTFSYISE